MEKRREMLKFSVVYAWLSFLNYAIKLWLAPAWYKALEVNHSLLMQFQYTNNEQSRLLQFLIPELFHRIFFLSIPHAYALARLLFVFLAFIGFHRFLRRWFTEGESLAGVTLLSCALAFTHQTDLQESSPLLMLVFILSLQAIRDNRVGWMLALFFVGGLVNETAAILPAVYFFYTVRFDRFQSVWLPAVKTLAASIPLAITLVPIRYMNRHHPVLGTGFHWPENWAGIVRDAQTIVFDVPNATYILFVVLFSGLIPFVFMGWRDKPLILRRAAWIIPFFVAAHLITGKIDEPRQMIPLGFVLIPLALWNLTDKTSIGNFTLSTAEKSAPIILPLKND